MKFGALLRSSAQEMPELQGLFNCYKQLKKRLKRLPERGEQAMAPESLLHGNSAVKAHERAFVALLVSDIQAFNETFVEREEQSVIKLSLIEQRNTADLRPNELAALYKMISELVRRAEARAQELAARLSQQQQQISLSVASPESSPVEKLISAARESVREIAVSAAHGNAALDEHLREQPTTSDEQSVEAGESEVVSRQPEAEATHPERAGDGEGSPATGNANRARPSTCAPSAADNKRKREEGNASEDQGDQHANPQGIAQRIKRSKGAEAKQPPIPIVLPPIMTRTGSIAADNGTPKGGTAPLRLSGSQAQGTAPGRVSSTSGRSWAGNDSNSGEHSRSSPPLTMGQGWAGGSQNILRQTQMALGLWEQLHDTASTPSTIVPPPGPMRTSVWERGSANSAA